MKQLVFLSSMTWLILNLTLGSSSEAKYREDLHIPQTHTLPQGFFQLSLERQASLQKQGGDASGFGHSSRSAASFGLYQSGAVGVEGGFSWDEPATTSITHAVFGHIRVRAMDLEEDRWSVALGVEKLGFVTNKNDMNVVYLTLQNKIGEDWITGVGAYNGSARFLVKTDGSPDEKGMFIGLWRQIQQRRGRLGLEYQSGLNFLGFLYAGMTLELAEGIYSTLGYGYANNQNLLRDEFLARVVVDF